MNEVPREVDWRGTFFERLVERFIYGRNPNEQSLDEERAYKNFAGKSFDQAMEMFRESSISYSEDLMWMPLKCFDYYVNAFTSYLLSPLSKGDADGANTYLGLIEFRLPDLRETSVDTNSRIMETLRFIAIHQEYFEAEPDLYDSFLERVTPLLTKIKSSDGISA